MAGPLRFLVSDDPRQAAKVRALFERTETAREPLFVSAPVALQILWVLAAVYEIPRAAILEALGQLLDLSYLRFEAESRLRALIVAAGERKIDLADLFIQLTGRDNDCAVTLSLNRKAAKDKRFELL